MHAPPVPQRHSTSRSTTSRSCRRQPLRSTNLCRAAAPRCHYETLGVSPAASGDAIKAAFRKLALKLHPDVCTAPGATEAFKQVTSSYEVLSDPQKRAAYNRQRAAQATSGTVYSSRRRGASSSSSSTYHGVYDDGDDGFAEAAQAGFWGWYEGSGSWQSSWQANSKKKKRQQQQQQQAAAVQQVLAQLHPGTVQMLQQMFGPRLERLNSLEELLQTTEELEQLRAVGPDDFDAGACASDVRGSSSWGVGGASGGSRQRPSAASGRSGRGRHNAAAPAGSRASSAAGSSGRAGRRSGSAAASSSRSSSWSPWFDELQPEELFEVMADNSNPAAAKAARAWVQDAAASGRLNPAFAADLGFFLALDFILPDEWGLDGSDGDDEHSTAAAATSERYKGRARPQSPRDYVPFSDDDAEAFEADELLDLSELFFATDALDDAADWAADDSNDAL